MTDKRRYDVFLSYSFQDQDWVREFESALSESGVEVFFDATQLAPGDRWQERIEEALRESSTLVVVVSPSTFRSTWTFFELGAALAGNKRIIPIVTEAVDVTEIPPLLMQFQFLRESSPRAAGIRVAEVLGKLDTE